MSTTEWRWVDIDGTEHVVGVDGLGRMLSSGSLPPYTLVWKTTWLGWHPAAEVPELAAALGSRKGAPRSISSSPTTTAPPPPPADRYASLPSKPVTLLGAERKDRASVPPPLRRTMPHPSTGPTTVRGPVAPPANLPGRSTMIGMMPPTGGPRPPGPPPRQPPIGGVGRSTMIGMATPPPPQGAPSQTKASGAPAEPGASAGRVAEPPAPPAPTPPPPAASFGSTLSAGTAASVAKSGAAPVDPAPTGPIKIRGVLPTLADEEEINRHTLRPVGAAPPPPRSAPQLGTGDAAPDSLTGAPTERAPVAALATATPLPIPPPPVAQLPSAPRLANPDLGSTKRSEGIPSRRPQSRGPGGMSSKAFTLATGISFLIPGTVVLVLALLKPRTGGEPEAATSAAPSASAAVANSPQACTLTRPAQRIAEPAFFQVPLITASTGDSRVAIGFAATKSSAMGLVLDPASFSVTTSFESKGTKSILGVVPLTAGGDVKFTVDQASPTLASERTVNAAEPFSLGVSAEGLARRAGENVSVIWPGQSEKPAITTPRVAAVAEGGFVVTFRHGGQEGKVLVGWLDAQGNKKSDLKAVPTDAVLVGTPAISAGPSGALVTFAAKSSPSEPYGIELSRVPAGEEPARARRFQLPPGGPGGEAISPSSEALPGGGYLLQWTEGAAGNRAVRTQVISADLVPAGDAITLSTADQNAGQGALWVGGDRALALFLTKTEGSHELWGALLRCP